MGFQTGLPSALKEMGQVKRRGEEDSGGRSEKKHVFSGGIYAKYVKRETYTI